MAKSKEKLIEEIGAEAKAKSVDVPVTEGKTVPELEQILTGLKTPPPPPEKDDDPEPDEDVKAFPYSVAPGKAITTKRGIIADGEEITKKDLDDGAFKAFIKSGHIKKG